MADLQSETRESSTHTPSEAISSKLHIDYFTATLPTRLGWSTPLILYKNCWLRPHALRASVDVQEKFKPRPDDIILAAHPKCGTTWLKALVFTITKRSLHTFADHPLLTCRPHVAVPFIGMRPGDLDNVDMLPSPRLLSTHLPLSLLPPTVSTLGCRIVCISRDPKDAFVSRWHFEKGIGQGMSIGIEDAFTMFCEGCSPFGPFWDRFLEYWKESLARPQEVIFLRYEEIVSDPVKVVRKLASFLGTPFTEEEESSGLLLQIVRFCSFESLSSLDVNQTNRVELDGAGGKVTVDPASLFREGKIGDWINHMSKDMGERMDRLVAEKFKGSGLMF